MYRAAMSIFPAIQHRFSRTPFFPPMNQSEPAAERTEPPGTHPAEQSLTGGVGTATYAAPEQLVKGQGYSEKVHGAWYWWMGQGCSEKVGGAWCWWMGQGCSEKVGRRGMVLVDGAGMQRSGRHCIGS
jgi:hypothetical protein